MFVATTCNTVTGGPNGVASCTPSAANAGNSWTTTTCNTVTTGPTLTSSCYSLIAPDYAISQRGTYRPADDQYVETPPGVIISPADVPRTARKEEAEQADAWFRAITGETFG